MAKNEYEIDYNDKRLTSVKGEESNALHKNELTYNDMVNKSDSFYQNQINAAKEYEKTQTKLQDEQTDFAIEKIEQEKAQAQKDYTKEQSGAYKDWQKQSNAYGVNAEQRAASGLNNDGYSESAQVSMFNTYQNRVATAREVYNQAILNYNNSITEARLQNNVAKAKIAYETLQKTLELSLEGFQYKNTLLLEKANTAREIQQMYHTRYQDVLKQINTENALAEEVRQYNASLAEDKRQFDAQQALQREQFEWQKAQAAKSGSSGGSGSIKKSSGSGKSSGKTTKKISNNGATTVIKETSGIESDNAKVDMQSVLNLGLGPISASRLNDLVSSGQVIEYVQDGKLKYKRSGVSQKLFNLGTK